MRVSRILETVACSNTGVESCPASHGLLRLLWLLVYLGFLELLELLGFRWTPLILFLLLAVHTFTLSFSLLPYSPSMGILPGSSGSAGPAGPRVTEVLGNQLLVSWGSRFSWGSVWSICVSWFIWSWGDRFGELILADS